MPERATKFDAETVRASWDAAADAYSEGQAAGRDHYRYAFFGPAQVDLCGDVSGLRILDLGCGNGYFAREMARRNARVTGVDLSPRMIHHALKREADEPLGITYHVADAAAIDSVLGGERFDMVTSCLALQDMPDVPGALAQAKRVLADDGRLVASITHPCSDMPFRQWEKDENGNKRYLCVDRYFERGPVSFTWKGWAYEFSTPAVHATIGDWFGWFRDAGFVVHELREPEPTKDALMRYPDLEDAARVPYYLLFDLRPGKAEDD